MKKIIEASDLPEKEKVYLKKDSLGWRVVEPIKVDGKINYLSLFFGGKRGLAFLIFCLIISGLFYVGINELIGAYKEVAKNPCSFCTTCQEQTRQVLKQISERESPVINFSFKGGEI